eukprot:jgi/Tetstr1/436524/TSEL_025349.t1
MDYAPVRPCRWSSDGFWVTCGCNKARPCAVVSWLMKAAGMQAMVWAEALESYAEQYGKNSAFWKEVRLGKVKR